MLLDRISNPLAKQMMLGRACACRLGIAMAVMGRQALWAPSVPAL